MRRAAIGLCLWLVSTTGSQQAMAQENEAQPPGTEATPPGEEPAASPPQKGSKSATPTATAPASEEKAAAANPWQDIYVVQRRAVIKRHRLELMPTYNVSLNNPLIRHHGVGGELKFYLSDVLFIGLEGTYYQKQLSEPSGHSRYYELGSELRVVPSVNRYVWSLFLDFGYVPFSGKFTFFNSKIAYWEAWISAGVGIFQTETVTRNPADQGFTNFPVFAGLLPGFGTRLWFTRWLALDAYIKNYIFADKLEPLARPAGMTGEQAKDKAISSFTFDVVFGVGLSFFLPSGFEYKTLR